ncbi:hypothetical protein V9T40_010624 [Parthenolecanium corni]|uniref:Uncharacterized protein n=1 Tax=Parthenolecanium corni TaxID=536013 RepID=A0AAN9XYN2_9HEMI
MDAVVVVAVEAAAAAENSFVASHNYEYAPGRNQRADSQLVIVSLKKKKHRRCQRAAKASRQSNKVGVRWDDWEGRKEGRKEELSE